MKDTKQQFEHVMTVCRDLFAKKLHDYGAAWRIMRPSSVTDQLFIKANRIRSIEIKGVSLVNEGIRPEFMAIVNYGIIGLIQLELGYAEKEDITEAQALELYDKYAKDAMELMLKKIVISTKKVMIPLPGRFFLESTYPRTAATITPPTVPSTVRNTEIHKECSTSLPLLNTRVYAAKEG